MFAVITGGSGSGKSRFAETFLQKLCPGEKIYLATMQFVDDEMKLRIRKHRQMRAGKQFVTIEQGMGLEKLLLPLSENRSGVKKKRQQGLLLECMSNLIANEMYDEHAEKKNGSEEEIAEYILTGIWNLRRQTEHMVIVTNELFSEPTLFEETKRYRKIFGTVNQQLAKEADTVIEVIYGIPVTIK